LDAQNASIKKLSSEKKNSIKDLEAQISDLKS
jgi:hypothetical protein